MNTRVYITSIFLLLNKFQRYHAKLNPPFRITCVKYSQVKFDKRGQMHLIESFKVAFREGFASRWYLVKFGNLEQSREQSVNVIG